jgi:monofunctional biosynthetic peptidoglycan transglycosylase
MRWLGAAIIWIKRACLAVALTWAALILAYTVLPPVSTLMLARWASARSANRDYVPLERVSPHLTTAVLASEDARFCLHYGVDWTELRGVVRGALDDVDGPRGASTIAMQSVKNTLLWPSRSVLRKALEIPLALVVNLVWGKRRTMEIYLNVAEWGDGVFGAQAAARRHFGKDAADLTAREAALLAAALPNPILRHAGRPSPALRRRAAVIERRAAGAAAYAGCVLSGS